MRIIYLTAGAAGMYCGSCLHDNAIAKAFIRLGHDTILMPTYTPIQTDEQSAASNKLFFGGLNVYLQQLSPVFRWMPRWMDGVLSSPRLVNWVASRSMGTTADKLGGLTVSMLRGAEGNQRKEVHRLCDWLENEQPDVVVFSNLLIAGCVEEIKRRLKCPVVVVLQGDDIFYNGLHEPYKSQALEELRRLAGHVDRFIVHSENYRQRMATMLKIDPVRVAVSPLSIDTADFDSLPTPAADQGKPPSIGYLARLAPEKGLHLLVDAFIEIAAIPGMEDVRLDIAGWLGPQNEGYWREQKEKLAAADLSDRYRYHGSVDRQGKLDLLSRIDVLCVPTTYEEPKGLFVLEGLAAGVPYVLPAHGAFPEMHDRHQAGHLYSPSDEGELVQRLTECMRQIEVTRQLGSDARKQLLLSAKTDGPMIEQEAREWLKVFEELQLAIPADQHASN
ncbi:MAG: glycosyltransferase family 4 protein [Aureliella sp.]